jgi:hypothetical protein
MAFNVGEAIGKFKLDGLAQSIEELKSMKRQMEVLRDEYKNQRSKQSKLIKSWQTQSSAVREATEGQKYFKGALREVNRAIDSQITKLRVAQNVAKTYQGNIASSFGSIAKTTSAPVDIRGQIQSSVFQNAQANSTSKFADFARREREIIQRNESQLLNELYSTYSAKMAEARTRMASAKSLQGLNDPISNFARSTQGLTSRIGQSFESLGSKVNSLGGRLKNTLNKSVDAYVIKAKQAQSATQEWWKRFGLVAVGFSIAYRAINAVEAAVGKLTRTFGSGITMMDEYVEGAAEISGMLSLFAEGGGDFSGRFQQLNTYMQGTMESMIRLAPKYRTSVESISTGLRELAQWGVAVTPQNAEDTINVLRTIDTIATTTGSSAKQIRQEIQAMFSGSARVTDQFTRMIKIRMPELFTYITDIGISAQKRWEAVTARFADFKQIYTDLNANIRAQSEIITNNTGIISMQALRSSGVYEKWVGIMQGLNDQLFDSEGKLGSLGETLYRVFYRTWELVERLRGGIVAVGGIVGNIVQRVRELPDWVGQVTGQYLKWAAILVGVRASFSLITGLASVALIPIKGLASSLGRMGGAAILLVGNFKKLLTPLQTIRNLSIAIAGSTVTWGVGIVAALVATYKLHQWMEKVKLESLGVADNREKMVQSAKNHLNMLDQEEAKYNRLYESGNISIARRDKELNAIAQQRYETQLRLFKLIESGADTTDSKIKGIFKSLMPKDLVEQFTSIFSSFAEITFPNSEDISKAFEEYMKGLTIGIDEGAKEQEAALVESARASYKGIFEDYLLQGADQFNKQIIEVAKKVGNVREELVKAKGQLGPGEFERMNSVLDSYVQSQVEHIKNSERLNDLANERNKIEQRIGEIQQQVDLGFINKAGGIREEINAQKALIGTLKARKKLVDDPTEVDSLIAAAQYKLLELQQNMKEQVGSGWEGFKQGVRDFTSDLYSNFQLWQRAAQDTASGMESAFETYFFDAMQGRFESFKDYFIGFLESIQKALSKLLAEQVTGQIVGGIAGAFSGGVGLSSQGGMVGSVPEGSFMTRPGGPILTAQRQYANGGWIKEPVFGVGLNSGESYSFAEKRPEYVNARPSGANVQVNVINQTGQPVEASQGKTRFDGKKFIVDVVMDDVNRGGRLRGLFGR